MPALRHRVAACIAALAVPVMGLACAAPALASTNVPTIPRTSAVHVMQAARVARVARAVQLSGALRVLRSCESGGRYKVNTGNGYYGAYQFSASTWHRLGMRGLPHRSRPEVQDAAAARLHDRRGSWADWGMCGRRASRVHA